jgi:hypothetical protein
MRGGLNMDVRPIYNLKSRIIFLPIFDRSLSKLGDIKGEVFQK